MADQTTTLPPEILTTWGLAVPDDEKGALLETLTTMRAMADLLYSVEGARYTDPAFGWTPVL